MEVIKPVKRNILLNPGPSTTTDTVKYALVIPDICHREKEFIDIINDIRQDLVKIVHGDPEKYTTVLFAGSGTIIDDVCVNSLVPENKKICIINNGAYASRMLDIAKYYGIPFINLEFPVDRLPDLNIIEDTLKNNKDIAVLAAVHQETGTGILNPIKEIGAIAQRYNMTFIVDTISTYAMIPMNIEEQNVDFVMSSAQKGLCAFTGISWVVGDKEKIIDSKNYPKRSYYCNLYRQYDFFEKGEGMQFTSPVQLIYALKQAIKEYWDEGEQAIWERLNRCWEAVQKGLREIGLENVIDPRFQSHLVTTVKAPEDPRFDFNKIHDYCYERGFTLYPGKMFGINTFRICNLGKITSKDIEDFFVVLKEAFIEIGFELPIKGK